MAEKNAVDTLESSFLSNGLYWYLEEKHALEIVAHQMLGLQLTKGN